LVETNDEIIGYVDEYSMKYHTQSESPKVIAAKRKKQRAAAAECEKRGGIKIGMTRAQVYASCWGPVSIGGTCAGA
jgi:hypothetical protein